MLQTKERPDHFSSEQGQCRFRPAAFLSRDPEIKAYMEKDKNKTMST